MLFLREVHDICPGFHFPLEGLIGLASVEILGLNRELRCHPISLLTLKGVFQLLCLRRTTLIILKFKEHSLYWTNQVRRFSHLKDLGQIQENIGSSPLGGCTQEINPLKFSYSTNTQIVLPWAEVHL